MYEKCSIRWRYLQKGKMVVTGGNMIKLLPFIHLLFIIHQKGFNTWIYEPRYVASLEIFLWLLIVLRCRMMYCIMRLQTFYSCLRCILDCIIGIHSCHSNIHLHNMKVDGFWWLFEHYFKDIPWGGKWKKEVIEEIHDDWIEFVRLWRKYRWYVESEYNMKHLINA